MKNKWRYSEEYQEVTTSKVGLIEGSKSICAISTFDKTEDEIKSNGKLISAAPEMLEALQNLENDNGSIPEPIWKMVQDAILKATGK
jgi:hypothetical protein